MTRRDTLNYKKPEPTQKERELEEKENKRK